MSLIWVFLLPWVRAREENEMLLKLKLFPRPLGILFCLGDGPVFHMEFTVFEGQTLDFAEQALDFTDQVGA
jgi:hypothetical protein